MAWVRSEYAGELAVLSAWLSMLLPWNIVYHPTAPLNSTVVFFRFSLFELQVRFPVFLEFGNEVVPAAGPLAARYPGTELLWGMFLTSPVGAVTHYDGYMFWGSVAWLVASIALLAAFLVSIALYLDEEGFQERITVDPVRLIGGLLGAAAVGTAAASVLYFLDRTIAGIPVPVGVLIVGALSVVLLRIDRV
jgi:hypothetical protein